MTLVSSVATLTSGGDQSSGGTTNLMLAVLLAATPVAIVHRILAHREVRVETILATLVARLVALFGVARTPAADDGDGGLRPAGDSDA